MSLPWAICSARIQRHPPARQGRPSRGSSGTRGHAAPLLPGHRLGPCPAPSSHDPAGSASGAQTCTPLPAVPRGGWRGPLGIRARATPRVPSSGGVTSSPGSLLTTWQRTRCSTLPGKRRLVRAQNKMSPKCHSNFLSVHKMADAPFRWHAGFSLEQQHLAPARRPPRHGSARARGAEGHGCRRAGRRDIIAVRAETFPGRRSRRVHHSRRLSSSAGEELVSTVPASPALPPQALSPVARRKPSTSQGGDTLHPGLREETNPIYVSS